tara:strand:+ start:70 stop:552 length:483 start_codon:yes stop_codon:yes gene_type:complete
MSRPTPVFKAQAGRTRREQKRAEFSFKLGEAARLWRTQLDARLKPLGLSFLQWSTLLRLSRVETQVVQKDLAFLVGIEGPAMVGILDRLVTSGWLERRVSENDRRANTVHLTTAGEDILEQAEAAISDVRNRLLDGMSIAELDTCIQMFEHIAARVREVE